MHIGIDKKIDFYQILIAINETLNIIKRLLQNIKPYYKHEKECLIGISKSIENIIELSSPLIQESWEVYCSYTFEEIESGFYDLEHNENFKDFLQKNSLEIDIECSGFHPATEYQITFKATTNNKSIVLQSINIPEKSVTLFSMNTQNKVCFLFDHKYIEEYDTKTTNFIVFTPPIDKTDNYFWLNLKKEQREQMRFTGEILMNKIKTYIKNYVIPQLLDYDKTITDE